MFADVILYGTMHHFEGGYHQDLFAAIRAFDEPFSDRVHVGFLDNFLVNQPQFLFIINLN